MPSNILPAMTIAAALLAWGPAAAQTTDAQQRPELKTPDIGASQQPQPTPQGTRSPKPTTSPNDPRVLAEALAAVFAAPPALDGTPVPRPNELAANPEAAAEPSQAPDPSDASSREVH